MNTLKEYFKARLMEDMAFDPAGYKASRGALDKAEKKVDSIDSLRRLLGYSAWSRTSGNVDRVLAQADLDDALAQHISLGSSDTVYTHDPVKGFVAITKLPKGMSDKLAADAMRFDEPFTPKQAQTVIDIANQVGGLHGVAGWKDPQIDPRQMEFKVPALPTPRFLGRRLTDPSEHARQSSRY